jgi:transcriptional regulator with XRE-family HTH domain
MKNTKHKRIPNSLRKHRKARGLLQKEVAQILRIKNASMISRWENGFCVPKSENMFRLGVLYRVMVDALFIDFRKSFEKDILRAEQEVLQNKTQAQNDL